MTKERTIEQQSSDCKIFGTKENCFGGATENECNHCDYKIQALEQQSSEDCVSRQAVLDNAYAYGNGLEPEGYCVNVEDIQALPPVTPTRKIGRWIYNRDIQNWVCSECSETPKTLGYCGTSAFMTEHFKFCNHCGSEMVGAENEENI